MSTPEHRMHRIDLDTLHTATLAPVRPPHSRRCTCHRRTKPAAREGLHFAGSMEDAQASKHVGAAVDVVRVACFEGDPICRTSAVAVAHAHCTVAQGRMSIWNKDQDKTQTQEHQPASTSTATDDTLTAGKPQPGLQKQSKVTTEKTTTAATETEEVKEVGKAGNAQTPTGTSVTAQQMAAVDEARAKQKREADEKANPTDDKSSSETTNTQR